MTQAQAASLVGVTQAHWSNLEAGKVYARPSMARKISDLTGVPVESLLNFSDTESGGHR